MSVRRVPVEGYTVTRSPAAVSNKRATSLFLGNAVSPSDSAAARIFATGTAAAMGPAGGGGGIVVVVAAAGMCCAGGGMLLSLRRRLDMDLMQIDNLYLLEVIIYDEMTSILYIIAY
jgi:hypothetical protein